MISKQMRGPLRAGLREWARPRAVQRSAVLTAPIADRQRTNRLFVSEHLFPSGPWVGFYNYTGRRDKHRMVLQLTFANGSMTGDGNDDVGLFLIQGRYDSSTRECYWTKTYIGAHHVFYRGFREGKGIWGTWDIPQQTQGGFHIWPRGAAEVAAKTAEEEEDHAVDFVPKDADEKPQPVQVN